MRKKILFVILTWFVVAFVVLVLYLLREFSPVKEFIAWALSIWPILAALGGIAIFISGWVIKHDFGPNIQGDTQSGKSFVLTPRAWAIGLSGMTGYPEEPDGEYWLRLEASVNPIDKPIDTLDLIIGGKTIPANHWPGKIVTAFTVYFNVTEWKRKDEIQVELQARIQGVVHSAGRINIDFNAELGGFPRYL